MIWTACFTDVGVERKVQSEIEKRDLGTLVATYTTTWHCQGYVREEEAPILARYVLIALPTAAAVDRVSGIEGVQHMLGGRITDQEVERLMLAHVTGALNVVRARAANGRFASTSIAQPRRKHKKRRRRPRHGKRLGNPTHIAAANHGVHCAQSAAGA